MILVKNHNCNITKLPEILRLKLHQPVSLERAISRNLLSKYWKKHSYNSEETVQYQRKVALFKF